MRVLSRKERADPRGKLAYAKGDVLTGAGVADATRDVDTVVHAATSSLRHVRATEVAGTSNVLDGARAAGAHFVYVSIVGVDRNKYPYYKAKLEAENVVESGGARWSIQRATQFHELLDRFLSAPVFPFTAHMAFQLLDAGDLSARLVEIVESGPCGRAEDFGGPEVLGIRAIEAARRRITKKKGRLLRMPAVGFLGDFDRGSNLCPGHALGSRTWEQWLSANRDSS